MTAPKGKADVKEFEEWFTKVIQIAPDIDTGPNRKFAELCWQDSRTAALKEILEALPDDSALLDCYKTVWNGQNSPSFEEGFKGSSNYIRAIIEKKLEGK